MVSSPGCIEHLLFIINFLNCIHCLLYYVHITLYFRETLFRVCCMLTVFYFAHIHAVSRIHQKRNAFVYATNTVQAESFVFLHIHLVIRILYVFSVSLKTCIAPTIICVYYSIFFCIKHKLYLLRIFKVRHIIMHAMKAAFTAHLSALQQLIHSYSAPSQIVQIVLIVIIVV